MCILVDSCYGPTTRANYVLVQAWAIAKNIVKKRCETSEVHPPAPSQYEADVHCCEVEATNTTNFSNTSILSKEDALNDMQPPVDPQSHKDLEDSIYTHADMHVGSAWLVSMT